MKEQERRKEEELKNFRLELGTIDMVYDKWSKEEDSLSSFMNLKAIKTKNVDFRLKLTTWKKKVDERKRQKRRNKDYSKRVIEALDKFSEDFNMEKQLVANCQRDFVDLVEGLHEKEKEEKISNDFLTKINEGLQVIEIKDLSRLLDNEEKIIKQDMRVLREFAGLVKTECVLNSHYFSFFDVPDLIIKKRYQKKDYDMIIAMLDKVKRTYMANKAAQLPDRPLEEIQITDEDLVPLELLDDNMA